LVAPPERAQQWSVVLSVHRSERADGLADALGELLVQPLADPFTAELVAVPARGMERWLTQRLSSRLGARPGRDDGVCANIDFPSPAELIGDSVATASGIAPEADPWRPERLVWPLLDVVESSLGEPWLHSLSAHLGHDADPPDPYRRARRLSTVRHLATLFHRYALHRPDMVLAWARGDGGAFGAGENGAFGAGDNSRGRILEGVSGSANPSSAAWQAELWRRLRARINFPDPADRSAAACERIRRVPSILALPERVCLFGLTRLPVGYLRVLEALGAGREIHIFLLHPSPVLWTRIAAVSAEVPRVLARSADPSAELPSNPLVRSWGRDARELQLVLGPSGEYLDRHHGLPTEPEPPAPSLLARIQADVRADRGPPGAPFPGQEDRRAPLAAEDRSIQVHACHGKSRQVEVLRDAILHALAQDPTLEPRDVIVMCPDIETFAPLIQATFGAGEVSPDSEPALENSPPRIVASAEGPLENSPPRIVASAEGAVDLRVRLADRSLRQTNPVLSVVAELLELAGQRLTASQVLDFADREPVRRRFRFDDNDLGRLQSWVADAGIRWGLDAAHRTPFQLEQVPSGTWRAGLDRVLLGVTMTEDDHRLFGGVLPLDDVDSGSIDLAGRLAELIARLGQALDALAGPQTLGAWARAIASAADALTRPARREEWQRAQLQRLLDELVLEATSTADSHTRLENSRQRILARGEAPQLELTEVADLSSSQAQLELTEVRALLAERLQGRPTRANFRTGHLTICTLVPMRSVPHRVVGLLGLDDGAFPRKAPRDGDDVMLEQPQVGERDPRSEDRQLLLDALLAASERLIISYTGNDERTNAVQPPAVPVGELLDVIDATACTAGLPARAQVLVRHPLQPFDPRNFDAGALVAGETWSFDPVTLDGARALIAPRHPARPFLTGPLPPLATTMFELEDLIRFVSHPVRAFLRQRLSVSLSDRSDELQDALSVELDGLERWAVGQRLLDALLAGVPGRAALLAEVARGTLPPGVLGQPVIHEVYPIVESIATTAGRLIEAGRPPGPVDVHLSLAGGRTLTGTVPGVSGDTLLSTTYSRLAPRHRLVAWVRLLALSAHAPETAFAAATIGRGRGADVAIRRIRPLGPDAQTRGTIAAEQLLALIDLYQRGMCEPLPIFDKSSAAYAEAIARGANPEAAGDDAWTSGWKFDKEDRELEHQLVLGGTRTFAELLAEPPAPSEHGAGWDPSETSRFGRLACRMWDGALEFEEPDA
jgi:exodeoxyribonuclease V gamma subunit